MAPDAPAIRAPGRTRGGLGPRFRPGRDRGARLRLPRPGRGHTVHRDPRIGIEDDGFYHFGCGALPWSLQPEPWPRKQRDLARILADPETHSLHAAFLAAEDSPYCDEREHAYRRLAHTLLALATPIPHLPEALVALAAAAQPESAVPDPAPSTTGQKGNTDEA